MGIKYRTCLNTIEKIEIDRETDKSVWVNGQRQAKAGGYYAYFDTFGEAKGFLITTVLAEIRNAENSINYQKRELDKIKAISEQA